MEFGSLKRAVFRDEIYQRLRTQLRAGQWSVGDRLPPMKELARQFGTSVRPVQQAYEQLDREGYVHRQRGRGTEVIDTQPEAELSDSVAVCMESGMHIYGELALLLAGELHQQGVLPTSVDSCRRESAGQMLLKLGRAGVRQVILHKNNYFDTDFLTAPAFVRTTFIGAVHWAGHPLAGMAAVLSDPVAGAQQVVDHFWELGHRKVLLLTTETQHVADPIPLRTDKLWWYTQMRHGYEFGRLWNERGGEWEHLCSTIDNSEVSLDQDALLQVFDQAEPPTAVFGLRDIEALRCQQILRAERPAVLARLPLVGYYNTPWSQAGMPPITSVDIRLAEITKQIGRLSRGLRQGDPPPTDPVLIEPELLVRQQSH
mgnify:FL=1